MNFFHDIHASWDIYAIAMLATICLAFIGLNWNNLRILSLFTNSAIVEYLFFWILWQNYRYFNRKQFSMDYPELKENSAGFCVILIIADYAIMSWEYSNNIVDALTVRLNVVASTRQLYGSSESAQFDRCRVVDRGQERAGRSHIPMQNVILVTISQRFEYLSHIMAVKIKEEELFWLYSARKLTISRNFNFDESPNSADTRCDPAIKNRGIRILIVSSIKLLDTCLRVCSDFQYFCLATAPKSPENDWAWCSCAYE